MEKWLKFHRFYKRIMILSAFWLIGSTLTYVFFLFANYRINIATEHLIFKNAENLPKPATILVLGSAPNNPFFIRRMKAAVDVYNHQKATHFILSGDNHISSYNEPEAMRSYLIDAGIPANKITLDYAGFRTLDSVVRSKKIFGQTNLIIISQQYHLARALFIAKQYGIDAIGYCAEDPSMKLIKYAKTREWFANGKAFLDLYLLNTEPKFLGPAVSLSQN